MRALSWPQIKQVALEQTKGVLDKVNGPTNSQSTLRLFGKTEDQVRVTLYRDNHAWCPYCQKVWLFLEEMRIPYSVKKVTMFCYGKKEAWYKKLVPNGMLPAADIDGKIYTESDVILQELEDRFGQLHASLTDPYVVKLRQLERFLFGAWCSWLCYPSKSVKKEEQNKRNFEDAVRVVEQALESSQGPFFLGHNFSIVDCVFVPYVERMNASLFYYKGYSLRSNSNSNLKIWFEALEERETYRGTQSDFHTHCHDLPPQMGGCYENGTKQQVLNKNAVDYGPYTTIPEVSYKEPEDSKAIAVLRVEKFKDQIIAVNPYRTKSILDLALRTVLTNMLQGSKIAPPADKGIEEALRYIRDRINVPRDMPIYSARRIREALEAAASMIGDTQPKPLPTSHRQDQNPVNFCAAGNL